jgi:hypothetical protein
MNLLKMIKGLIIFLGGYMIGLLSGFVIFATVSGLELLLDNMSV